MMRAMTREGVGPGRRRRATTRATTRAMTRTAQEGGAQRAPQAGALGHDAPRHRPRRWGGKRHPVTAPGTPKLPPRTPKIAPGATE